jgi:hypothetical protein
VFLSGITIHENTRNLAQVGMWISGSLLAEVRCGRILIIREMHQLGI